MTMPADPYLLSSAVLLGLLTSVHCVGMCTPIVSTFNFALLPSQSRRHLHYQLLFMMGRVTTYAFLAALTTLAIAPVLPVHSALPHILAGVTLLTLGLYYLTGQQRLLWVESLGKPLWQILSPLTRRLLPVNSVTRAFLFGTLWGFLPCGLLYSVLLLAAATGDLMHAVAYSVTFGITVSLPLLGIAVLSSPLRHPAMRRLGGLWLLLIGTASVAAPWFAPALLPETVQILLRFCLPPSAPMT